MLSHLLYFDFDVLMLRKDYTNFYTILDKFITKKSIFCRTTFYFSFMNIYVLLVIFIYAYIIYLESIELVTFTQKNTDIFVIYFTIRI